MTQRLWPQWLDTPFHVPCYIIYILYWWVYGLAMKFRWVHDGTFFFLSFYGLYMKIRCRPWPGLCSFAQVTEGLVPSIRSDLLPCFVDCIHDFCSTKNWKGVHCPPDNPRHVSSLHCNASSQAIFQMSR